MIKLNNYEICKLLESLIGENEPIGDTQVDRERLINLQIIIAIADWCLDGVLRSAQTEGYEYSVVQNRELAKNALLEWKACIGEYEVTE